MNNVRAALTTTHGRLCDVLKSRKAKRVQSAHTTLLGMCVVAIDLNCVDIKIKFEHIVDRDGDRVMGMSMILVVAVNCVDAEKLIKEF